MIKTGIIKAISRKEGGKNAFTLENEQIDGKDVWFNGFELAAQKGDEIEFELTINGSFNNFSKVKIIKPAQQSESDPNEPTIKSEDLRPQLKGIYDAFSEAQRRFHGLIDNMPEKVD